MQTRTLVLQLVGAVFCSTVALAPAIAAAPANRPIGTAANQLSYRNMPNLPRCLTVGVAAGNPMAGPSTVVLRFAPRCEATMHWHTPNEQLVMIKGSGVLQMQGEAPKPVTVGAYNFQPSQHPHQFMCGPSSECMLFLMSDAKFDIHWIDPSGREITLAQAQRSAGKR